MARQVHLVELRSALEENGAQLLTLHGMLMPLQLSAGNLDIQVSPW